MTETSKLVDDDFIPTINKLLGETKHLVLEIEASIEEAKIQANIAEAKVSNIQTEKKSLERIVWELEQLGAKGKEDD